MKIIKLQECPERERQVSHDFADVESWKTNKTNSRGYREQIGSCQKGSELRGGQKGVKGGQLHNDG